MRWEGHVACICEKGNAYRIFVGKTEGKRPLGEPRRRWTDSMKMGHRDIERDFIDWIDVQDESGPQIPNNVSLGYVLLLFPHQHHVFS
jgi:hypothetical protein